MSVRIEVVVFGGHFIDSQFGGIFAVGISIGLCGAGRRFVGFLFVFLIKI
jgi:hypothetical protein